MFDKKVGGQDCNVLYRVKVGVAVCCAVLSGGMLAWNANANAKAETYAPASGDEITDVSAYVDKQPLAIGAALDTAAVEAADSGSALTDVADLDTSKEDQHPQLALADAQAVPSLDVVDTGSSVEFPQAVGDVDGGIDYQKATVDLDEHPVPEANGLIDQGNQLEADSNAMLEQDIQPPVTDASVELPVTHTADVQAPVAGAASQLKEASSEEAAGSESAGLPYAVVLALLALIGLVPVARRDDHHGV